MLRLLGDHTWKIHLIIKRFNQDLFNYEKDEVVNLLWGLNFELRRDMVKFWKIIGDEGKVWKIYHMEKVMGGHDRKR